MSKKDVTLKDGWVQKIKGQILKPLVDIIPSSLRKKLTVQAEVKGAEKVDQAKQKIESLPKTKTVKMKIEKIGNFPALEMTGNNLEKKISVKSKVSGLDQVQQLRTTINTLPKTITVTPPQLWRRCVRLVRLVRPVRQPAGTLHCAALLRRVDQRDEGSRRDVGK